MTKDVPESHPDLADYYDTVRRELETPRSGYSAGRAMAIGDITLGKALHFTRGIHPLTGDRWVYTATDARGRSIFGGVIHGLDGPIV